MKALTLSCCLYPSLEKATQKNAAVKIFQI